MECPHCQYILDPLDTTCPRCKNPVSGDPDVPVFRPPVQLISPQQTTTPPAAVSAPQAHSDVALNHYRRTNMIREGLIGVLFGFFVSTFCTFLLASFPGTASRTSFFGPGHMFLFAMILIIIGAFLGWRVATLYEAADADRTSEPGASFAHLIGVLAGAILMIYLMFTVSMSTQIPIQGSRLRPSASEAFMSALTRSFFIIWGTIIASSLLIGYRKGYQEYEIARRAGQLLPITNAPKVRRRADPMAKSPFRLSNWIVFFLCFGFPCMGVVLWMSFNNSDEEKARVAGFGTVLGLILAFKWGMAKIMARTRGTS